jgi:hypothetical protein
MEMKERMNGKMLELTIENKELKKRMGEAWNEAKHAY